MQKVSNFSMGDLRERCYSRSNGAIRVRSRVSLLAGCCRAGFFHQTEKGHGETCVGERRTRRWKSMCYSPLSTTTTKYRATFPVANSSSPLLANTTSSQQPQPPPNHAHSLSATPQLIVCYYHTPRAVYNSSLLLLPTVSLDSRDLTIHHNASSSVPRPARSTPAPPCVSTHNLRLSETTTSASSSACTRATPKSQLPYRWQCR